MGKRFTETEKWKDKWFRALSPDMKLGWIYLLDNCDAAGVIEVDEELANFQVGSDVDWKQLIQKSGDRIKVLECGKLWLTKFVKYQYGKLSPACKPHAPAIAILSRYGLNPEQTDAYKHGSVTTEKRKRVLKRDGYECCYCGCVGDDDSMVVDHVIPKISGGNDSEENLVAACPSCNSKKSDRSVVEFVNALKEPNKAYQRLCERLPKRLFDNLQEKEKEKDIDKEKEKEKVTDKDSPVFRSSHGKDSGFVEAWGMWKRKLAVKHGAMDEWTEQLQLKELERFSTDDAIGIVQFSTSRTNCVNLITNGDHKRARAAPVDDPEAGKALGNLIIAKMYGGAT